MVLVGWLFSLGLCPGGISQFEQSLMQMLASDNQVWSTESLAYISFFLSISKLLLNSARNLHCRQLFQTSYFKHRNKIISQK